MNVVLICLDTFRADFVAAAGRNNTIRTPHMDRLVREGVLFDNAFGEGQPTIQFRRALLTGMRSFPWEAKYETRGLWPNAPGWHQIPAEQTTLAEALLEKGYTTGFVSDTYHMFKPTQNFTRGFASWEFIRGQEEDPWRIGPMNAIDMSKYLPPDGSIGSQPRLIQYLLNMQDRKTEDDYLPAQVFDKAIRFIDEARENAPFFLYVDCFDPHEPWDPPRAYADMYDPDWDEGWEPIVGVQPAHSEKMRRRYIANYYGECTFVDKCIGKLVARLEALNLLDETLILIASDHGTELMDHGSLKKMDHNARYRHNSEILWLMRLPRAEHAGKRIGGLVMNQDIFPTILGLCGVEHGPVDGADIMPLVTGAKQAVRDHAVISWAQWANVRDLEYSFTCDYEAEEAKRDPWLFDLRRDPGETQNIAQAHPEICQRMIGRLEELLGRKLPVPVPQHKWRTKGPSTIWQQARGLA